VWNRAALSAPPRTFQGQADQLLDVAWHPSGTHLALAGGDGTVKVWDLAHAGPGQVVESDIGMVMDLAFRADGRQLMVVRPGRELRLRPWPTDEAGPHTGKHGKGNRGAYRPDGRQLALATGDDRIELRDPDTNRVHTEIRVPVRAGAEGAVLRLAYSPDSRVLATADLPRSEKSMAALTGRWPADVQLWRAGEDGWTYAPFARLTGATAWAEALAFSADGRWFAACGQDSMVHVWDLTRLRPEGVLAPAWSANPVGRPFKCLAFSPRGSLFATGGADGTVRLWDAESGEERGRLTGHTGLVAALAFTPDGSRLASAGFDGLVRVWDVANRHELLTLQGHTNRVLALAFTPDGHVLVSGGDDGAVRAWDGSP
jgi:WD40 repeat protein